MLMFVIYSQQASRKKWKITKKAHGNDYCGLKVARRYTCVATILYEQGMSLCLIFK